MLLFRIVSGAISSELAFLNVSREDARTTALDKLFQILTTRAGNEYFRKS